MDFNVLKLDHNLTFDRCACAERWLEKGPLQCHFRCSVYFQVAQTLQANAHLVQPHLVHLLREKSSSAVLEAVLKRLPDTLTAVIIRGNLADNKVLFIAVVKDFGLQRTQ